MAKRIKVSGKPPRGLSKSTRMHKEGYRVKKSSGEYDPTGLDKLGIDPKDFDQETKDRISKFVKRAKRGSTAPSSTRKKLVKEGNRKFIGPAQPDPAFQLSYGKFREFARENPDLMEPRGSVPRTAEQLGISRHKTYRGSKKIKGLPESSIELDELLSNFAAGPRKIGDPRKSIASERLKRKLADYISRMRIDF